MPGKLYLTVESGKEAGKKFSFSEAMVCIVGRDKDCTLILPSSLDPKISRNHCALGVNPPYMSVRDLGSSNGTYINGKKLSKDQDFNLRDGDLLTIGDTRFRYKVVLPTTCDACGAEIPDSEKHAALVDGGDYICYDCREKVTEKLGFETKRVAICSKCGNIEQMNDTGDQSEDFICDTCLESGLGSDSPYMKADVPTGIGMTFCNFGNLELKGKLGEGGMGAVYRAFDHTLQTDVAIKVLLPELTTNTMAVRSFMREIKHTQALKHPNIVGLYDIGMESDTVYFTMEYCNTGNLQKYITKREGPLELQDALYLFSQILDAVEFAHKANIPGISKAFLKSKTSGIIHRDLKPGNIFLHECNGRLLAKVGDFGISKAFNFTGLGNSTCTGTAFGTPAFMPRQQVTNFKGVGSEVDIWACVAILYFMLTKKTPRHIDPNNALQSLLHNRIIPIQAKNPELPSAFADLIDTALDDSVDIKYKTAGQLRDAMQSTA